MWYYIYYGTKTGSGTNYEIEGVDLIETSDFILEKLLPETKYYIAVRAIDEFGTESAYSQELEYTTLKKWQVSEAISFRITKVNITDATTLEFLFSTNLNTSVTSSRTFLIENTQTRVETPIDISEIDPTNPKNILVVLKNPLAVAQSYKVTVLDIRDATGKNIESWIDAFINFTTPASFVKTPVVIPPVMETPPEEVPLTSASENTATGNISSNETSTLFEKLIGNNAGETVVSTKTLETNTLQAAQESTKLPQTGPTQWILLFTALMSSALIYFFHSRRTILKK